METLVFYGVEDKNIGEIDMEFDSGDSYSGPAVVLTIKVVDVDTKEKRDVDLIIPKSCGPELLVALLTEDQWDAVCNV